MYYFPTVFWVFLRCPAMQKPHQLCHLSLSPGRLCFPWRLVLAPSTTIASQSRGSPFPWSQPAATTAHRGADLLHTAGAHGVVKLVPCNAALSPTALKQQLFLQQSSIFVTLIPRVLFTGAGLVQKGGRATQCLLVLAVHGDHG